VAVLGGRGDPRSCAALFMVELSTSKAIDSHRTQQPRRDGPKADQAISVRTFAGLLLREGNDVANCRARVTEAAAPSLTRHRSTNGGDP
jgi:hypothetical protein